MAGNMETDSHGDGVVILRHRAMTRITHWFWAVALFFLLLSGLQIFNAHPTLYIGQQSGFEFENEILSIRAMQDAGGQVEGVTRIFGASLNTTGVLGVSGPETAPSYRAFPAWATLPSYQDLATGRVVHFFFAWVFSATFLVWLLSSLINRHLHRDILPSGRELRAIPQSFAEHLRLRFRHDGNYNVLQKLSYATVLLVLFPLMILTGLTMSPSMNAAWPWLLDIFGGRQTARTLHFIVMLLLLLFFVIHIVMVIAAGPLNEMRSIITGRYRVKAEKAGQGAQE